VARRCLLSLLFCFRKLCDKFVDKRSGRAVPFGFRAVEQVALSSTGSDVGVTASKRRSCRRLLMTRVLSIQIQIDRHWWRYVSHSEFLLQFKTKTGDLGATVQHRADLLPRRSALHDNCVFKETKIDFHNGQSKRHTIVKLLWSIFHKLLQSSLKYFQLLRRCTLDAKFYSEHQLCIITAPSIDDTTPR
jgi:hypothetical protein